MTIQITSRRAGIFLLIAIVAIAVVVASTALGGSQSAPPNNPVLKTSNQDVASPAPSASSAPSANPAPSQAPTGDCTSRMIHTSKGPMPNTFWNPADPNDTDNPIPQDYIIYGEIWSNQVGEPETKNWPHVWQPNPAKPGEFRRDESRRQTKILITPAQRVDAQGHILVFQLGGAFDGWPADCAVQAQSDFDAAGWPDSVSLDLMLSGTCSPTSTSSDCNPFTGECNVDCFPTGPLAKYDGNVVVSPPSQEPGTSPEPSPMCNASPSPTPSPSPVVCTCQQPTPSPSATPEEPGCPSTVDERVPNGNNVNQAWAPGQDGWIVLRSWSNHHDPSVKDWPPVSGQEYVILYGPNNRPKAFIGGKYWIFQSEACARQDFAGQISYQGTKYDLTGNPQKIDGQDIRDHLPSFLLP